MKYLKFTYVDATTGISIAAEPALSGQEFPQVVGLQFVWARESAYPTPVPELFGTCPDAADTQIDGVLGVYNQTDFEQMHADELALRNPVPKEVSMRQARLALLQSGLLATVEQAVADSGEAAKIEWEYAAVVQRHAGLIPAMATALGMTDEQIDALFVLAATL